MSENNLPKVISNPSNRVGDIAKKIGAAAYEHRAPITASALTAALAVVGADGFSAVHNGIVAGVNYEEASKNALINEMGHKGVYAAGTIAGAAEYAAAPIVETFKQGASSAQVTREGDRISIRRLPAKTQKEILDGAHSAGELVGKIEGAFQPVAAEFSRGAEAGKAAETHGDRVLQERNAPSKRGI